MELNTYLGAHPATVFPGNHPYTKNLEERGENAGTKGSVSEVEHAATLTHVGRMCARFELNDTRFGPGKPIAFWRDSFPQQLAWAGFARRETLRWWQAKGGVLVDIPAHRFAERSKKDGRLIWADVPTGQVIRGLVDPSGNQPLVKVVTRAPTAEEMLQFEHPRMPFIESPLWSADPIAMAPEPNYQPELF